MSRFSTQCRVMTASSSACDGRERARVSYRRAAGMAHAAPGTWRRRHARLDLGQHISVVAPVHADIALLALLLLRSASRRAPKASGATPRCSERRRPHAAQRAAAWARRARPGGVACLMLSTRGVNHRTMSRLAAGSVLPANRSVVRSAARRSSERAARRRSERLAPEPRRTPAPPVTQIVRPLRALVAPLRRAPIVL